jgi:DNA-binding NtrC family response regulator
MNEFACRVCLVEDDEILGEALSDRLTVEGYACDWHRTGTAAMLALQRKRFEVVVSDIRLPDLSGEDLFVRLRAEGVTLPPFIFVTGHGAVDSAVRLLKLGAEDYLTKPFDVRTLLGKIRDLCVKSRPLLAGEPQLGISSAMRRIEATLPRLASSDSTVLITGESGVGKEEVARMLHRLGDPEGRKPFVAVNCGAITETLVEAELFGHEKGAFTGAVRDKRGVFEQADGGTLFLDEIGDMPMGMQIKLLRAIQERQITRVGAEDPIPVSIRLVCATHQDLRRKVEQESFREDLYYRVHVIHLHVPPLRERREDILWLAERLLARECNSRGRSPRSLHRSAQQPMLDYPWPGNVRELRHVLERACVLSNQSALTAESLFEEIPDCGEDAEVEGLADHLAVCEKRYLERVLRRNEWRISDTAAALGISRKNLWEKMRRYGISSARGES